MPLPDQRTPRDARRKTAHWPHTSPYPAVRPFFHLPRLPGGTTRPSARCFPFPAIGRPRAKATKYESGHPEDVRFSMPAGQRRGPSKKIIGAFWGEGWGASTGSDRRRPAGPCPLRRRKLRASTATQSLPSSRTGLSLLPTAPPVPRRGRGHPDGWPRNWRVRNRRKTGRCAAA